MRQTIVALCFAVALLSGCDSASLVPTALPATVTQVPVAIVTPELPTPLVEATDTALPPPPTDTAVEVAKATVAPGAISVGGKTGSKSAPFKLEGGAYAVDYSLKDNTGSSLGCYVGYMDLVEANVTDPSKHPERISSMSFMDTGTFSETSFVYDVAPGTYYIDTSISTCEWSVSIHHP